MYYAIQGTVLILPGDKLAVVISRTGELKKRPLSLTFQQKLLEGE